MLSVAFFRRVAFLTALFAYLQIALGGVVRVTGSGLGCPDWPLCHGRPYPPADLHSIIEYSHRTVGTVTGVLLIATVVLAWLVFRNQRPLVAWLATASLVAIAAEGAVGGIVVVRELAPWLVLIHLALAMIILGFLLAAAILSLPASTGMQEIRFRRIAAFAAASTYVMLLTGSTVVASSADESCHAWPLCGNGFAFDFAGANAFTMLHRGAVLLIGIVLVYALVSALQRKGLSAVALATLLVLALQVVVGAGAALTDAALFNGLHVAIATLVWSGMLSIALLTLPRADREPALSRLAVNKGPA
jgi:heme A synthase